MNWKEILGQIAPTIATAFGVPPMVTGALTWVGEKVLGKPAGTPATQDELQQLIEGGDPATLLKLKQADLDYKAHLADLGVQLEVANVADRGSARDLAKVRGIAVQAALTLLYQVGYFGLLYLVFSGNAHVTAELHDVAMILIGVMTAAEHQILTFWFGSTSGSQNKDAALAAAAVSP